MQTPEIRAAIAAMGTVLKPEVLQAVQALFRDEQDRLALAQPVAAADLAYGPDPRQRLDIYVPTGATVPLPILLWVHGGGFIRGDKGGLENPYNAHVGRWAVRNDMVGVVINYRLAPSHIWPSGTEDIALAVDWLRANASDHGGDPNRIILIGTSAGAAHIAGFLAQTPDPMGIVAAVFLSGLYGVTPLDERDTLYYGPPDLYASRRPLGGVVASTLPIMFVGAEFDPPRFQSELIGVLSARLKRHGTLPRAVIASGHNHFSAAYHLGTEDTRLTDEILTFIGEFT